MGGDVIPSQSKVEECCGWEFAAKLGEFDYGLMLVGD